MEITPSGSPACPQATSAASRYGFCGWWRPAGGSLSLLDELLSGGNGESQPTPSLPSDQPWLVRLHQLAAWSGSPKLGHFRALQTFLRGLFDTAMLTSCDAFASQAYRLQLVGGVRSKQLVGRRSARFPGAATSISLP